MKYFFKYHILILLTISIFSYNLSAQPIHFFQEKIEVEINSDYCSIKGIYYFKNLSSQEIRRTLYYPFVVNNELPFPYKIQVKDLINSKNIPFRISDKGIYFPINVNSDSISVYQVIYYQKASGNKIEYILTTTQKWRRPLEHAVYIIKMPVDYKMKYLSISPYKKEIRGGQKILSCKKLNFMPDKNLIIQWDIENANQ